MEIGSIDEDFDVQNTDSDDVSYSRWNGRDIEYPSTLREPDCSQIFEHNNPSINKNFLSHGVRGLRHAGRNVRRFVKRHKKLMIVAGAVIAAAIIIIATQGAGTSQAASAVAAAAATSSSAGSKRKRDDDEPSPELDHKPDNKEPPVPPSKPPPSYDYSPPKPTYLPPPPEISGPNWRIPSGPDQTTFPQTYPLSSSPNSPNFEWRQPTYTPSSTPLSSSPTSPTPHRMVIDPDAPPRIYPNNPSSDVRFQVPGSTLARGAIGGINGMGNSFEQAQANGNYLGQLSGNYQIDWVYNRTHSIPVDIAESVVLNYNGISAPARELRENWMKFHMDHFNDPDAKYLQICHSQGAIHVRNALENAPPEIRDRVIVIAIAPAAIIPKNLCFDSFNYVSKRDPIVISAVYGEAAFHYDADASYEERMAEPRRQALNELILLDPHPDAPLVDHSFDSPTFVNVIGQRVQDYTHRYGDKK